MKPLVYYCRWQGATLRLRGRDDTAVWGQLVFTNEDGVETTQDFRFILAAAQLILVEEGKERVLVLDDMGVPLGEDE
jgi:hypothetical protein